MQLLPAVLSAAAGAAVQTAPPFSYSLDQAVPCPRGSQDYLLTDAAGPVDLSADPGVAAVLAAIPGQLRTRRQQLRSPSTGVLVAHNGRVLAVSFDGTAKVNGTAPPTDSSGFLIASISKTFTTTMLYKLRDAGKLPPRGVDSLVTDVLPSFKLKDGGEAAITLRSLAMHSSGMPRETPDCPGCSTPPTTAEMLGRIAELETMCPPWMFTHYSNLGLALLGRALETLAGKSWEDYIREDIAAPLGMRDTGAAPWQPAVLERMAEGVDPDTQEIVRLSNVTTWGAPAGGIHSSARDMATWTSFLMDAGNASMRAEWSSVLAPASRAEMRAVAVPQGDGVSGIGQGTFETAYIAGRRWAANKLGCLGGYRSAISIVPSLGLSVFGVATSTCDIFGDGDAVSFPILSALVPAVETALQASALRLSPLPSDWANMQGRYCSHTVRLENVTYSGAEGKVLVVRGAGGEDYPFALQYVKDIPSGHRYRMVMGPELWLPESTRGCSQPDSPGADLCPISCPRKMARGSGALADFKKDSTGKYVFQGCTREPL